MAVVKPIGNILQSFMGSLVETIAGYLSRRVNHGEGLAATFERRYSLTPALNP